MFTRILASLFLLLLLPAHGKAQSSSSAAEERRVAYDRRLGPTGSDTYRAAARIQVGKPIGEFEAYALTWAYFLSQISGCGFPALPEDRGDRWVAATRVGIAGAPGPQIIVEKKTGLTYSPGRPKVKDPKEYLKFVRNI